ncbi:hypothetical protein JCM16163A_05120 [Paenibacillus sp. YK5]|uniref:hypothetical protein n=1 Tax=Paenibacillus sp. Pae108 TaxID=2926019 RepID=UPI0006D0359A|nr:hypothetical protein [Paenibacillus sp. Pae108]
MLSLNKAKHCGCHWLRSLKEGGVELKVGLAGESVALYLFLLGCGLQQILLQLFMIRASGGKDKDTA